MLEYPTDLPGPLPFLFADDDALARPSDADEDTAGSAQPERGQSRVLVVDDQNLIADTLVEILANLGFEAVAAYDGWEALDVAARFQPHWLISDVLMPRMNGVELAIAVRQKFPATEILLFSGQAATADLLERARSQGHEFEILAKPVHPTDLLAKLRG